MAEQIQPQPEFAGDILDEAARLAVQAVFDQVIEDPELAVSRLQLMVEGKRVVTPEDDGTAFKEQVDASIEQTRNGRDLLFDDYTEDQIFTPGAKAAAEKVKSSPTHMIEINMTANAIHRWFEFARYARQLRQENPTQQNPSSAA